MNPQSVYSIADCLQAGLQLQPASDSARLDTELLLCHALSQPRSYLYTWPEKILAPDRADYFFKLLNRRRRGEPIAYILGSKEFWSLQLLTDNSTLIPRPETELLVEIVLRVLPDVEQRVLDLGTGTGAIALALASERPGWQITACDIEAGACALAKNNRKRLKLDNVTVIKSDWFADLGGKKFDCIVSNPPYIDADDIHLTLGDVRFEPRAALVAEDKGLADIRHIVTNARDYLAEAGWLLLEHGYNQAKTVRELMRENGYHSIETTQDLSGNDRVTRARTQ